MPVSASVVFVNPEFTLYQAPLSAPFIFPNQLKRYMKDLNAISAKLSGKHRRLAEKLSSLHIEESSFLHLPKYEYDQLRKGIVCDTCSSFSCAVKGRSMICEDCGHAESVETRSSAVSENFGCCFQSGRLQQMIFLTGAGLWTRKKG